MTAKPKLPLSVKFALCFFGATGFLTFALAALSMFIWTAFPITLPENRSTAIYVAQGVLVVPRHDRLPGESWFGANSDFPAFFDKSLYVFRFDDAEGYSYAEVPLISIALGCLVAFFLIARKAAKMRRKEIFAAPTGSQEPS